MTPPNAITLARMLVVPVVVWLILADFANHERWAAVAYGIAASTDSLDGYLARHRGWTSVGGVFLDPLADKLLVMGALIALVEQARVSAWVVLIIVAREFAVTGLRLVAAGGRQRHRRVAARQAQDVLAERDGRLPPAGRAATPAGPTSSSRSRSALTIWSFADYFWRGRHHFHRARSAAAMIEVVLIAAAYLAGSLPFGYWLVRIFRSADIRTLGSKNTGMTNVWRNFGWRFGVATLVLDVVKGALPVLAALHWSGPLTASIAGIVAMLGHGYPVLLGFGGGKGVATGGGAALALFPAGVGIAVLAWAIVFLAMRYVSLASLVSGRGVPGRRGRARRASGR